MVAQLAKEGDDIADFVLVWPDPSRENKSPFYERNLDRELWLDLPGWFRGARGYTVQGTRVIIGRVDGEQKTDDALLLAAVEHVIKRHNQRGRDVIYVSDHVRVDGENGRVYLGFGVWRGGPDCRIVNKRDAWVVMGLDGLEPAFCRYCDPGGE